jgi:hypothetical protein
MLDQFIAGFELGSIVFIALQFIVYCWNRSTPQKFIPAEEKPITITVTPELPMIKAFEKLPERPVMAAKSIASPRTVINTDEDSLEWWKQKAKELGIKNVHSYKKVESLRKAIDRNIS